MTPQTGELASVVTVPVCSSIKRTRAPVCSPTATVAPSGLTATSEGTLKLADAPTPSVVWPVPEPARRLVVPLESSIRRIR